MTYLWSLLIAALISALCSAYFQGATAVPLSDRFEESCLDAHNYYRSLHGSPDLDLDDEVSRNARNRARQIANSDNIRSEQSEYGENTFWYGSSSRTMLSENCSNVVKTWYDTGAKYDYDNPEDRNNFSRYGTFTQVVWKSTTKLGCGQALGRNNGLNGVYVVCNYSPAGNLRGAFGDNIGERSKPSRRN